MHPIRITPLPVRRQVEEHLRRAIMEGVYAPGEHLPDRVLCEQLGVSRSIVREAVRLLEAEGLVTVVPYRGPFVALLSATEAAQVYEVRAALEALAGAGFAERASEEERTELRRVYEALAGSDPTHGRHALLELKRRFYDVLLRGCRNTYAARMLEQLLNRNTQLRATSLSAPDRLPATIREIGRIVEAIERRDAEAARQACLDHVRAAATVALRILRDLERQASSGASDDASVQPSLGQQPRSRRR
jgi:DNA-binding GntR family transcriptional regulator